MPLKKKRNNGPIIKVIAVAAIIAIVVLMIISFSPVQNVTEIQLYP